MNHHLTIAALAGRHLFVAGSDADRGADWSLELVPGHNVRLFGADHDFTGDGWIGTGDLAVLLAAWGVCPQ